MGLILNQFSDINYRHPLMRGIVSRWKVVPNFVGGSRLVDLCGRNHGTLTNGPTWSSSLGRPGGSGSIYLSANGHALRPPAPITLTMPYTFSFWMFPTAYNGTNPGIWRSGAFADGGEFNIFQGATGRPWIRDSAADILKPASGYNVPLNEWTHCTFQVSSTASAFAANGVVKHSGTGGSVAPVIHFIGWQSWNNERVTGYCDDFCFYSGRYLSSSEVFALYQATRQQYDPTLNYSPFVQFGRGLVYDTSNWINSIPNLGYFNNGLISALHA